MRDCDCEGDDFLTYVPGTMDVCPHCHPATAERQRRSRQAAEAQMRAWADGPHPLRRASDATDTWSNRTMGDQYARERGNW